MEELGVEISRYSYKKGNNAYLEEDCDAPKFIFAHKKKYPEISIVFKEEHSNQDSIIRSYPRFN